MAKLVTMATISARAVATAILLNRKVPRFGTAASEVRIMPELYSLPTTSTPNTIIASWPRLVPAKLMKVGSKESWSRRLMSPNSFFDRAEISMPRAMVTTTARPSVHTVDATDRILVHSDRTTCVAAMLNPSSSRCPTAAAEAAPVAVAAAAPRRAAARRARGTPRTPRSAA
ncbi:hypothetical protein SVIOM342S_02528 [Streptomyces violaceorubidus]